MRNDIYMLWLSALVHQVGSRKLNALLDTFGNANGVFNAPLAQLEQAMTGATLALKHITHTRNFEYIETLLRQMEAKGIAYISRDNIRFPTLLKEIPDPPLGIFFMGTLPANNTEKVAIIGSRKCSEYGLLSARHLARPLAAAGVVIVSGMARGVDSMAHRGALEGKGVTMAVLGCGVDICYPAENKQLKEDICKNGCVLSEYAPGVRPAPGFFPARNRIISGLSRGIIVTEAGLRSGTLITVDQAQEQGREVLAVPGNISSKLSQGTNQLIRDGAYPIADHQDVLHILGITPQSKPDNITRIGQPTQTKLAPDEKRVYDCLSMEPISFDMLVDMANIDIGRLHLICTSLELKGLAKKLPGARYIAS